MDINLLGGSTKVWQMELCHYVSVPNSQRANMRFGVLDFEESKVSQTKRSKVTSSILDE